MNTLIVSFQKLNNNELYAKAKHIVASLGEVPGVTHFPEPFPAPFPGLSDINDAANALQAAIDKFDSPPVTAERRALRVPIIEMLQSLAGYLEALAADNPEWLEYTGYDIRKTRVNVLTPPAIPENVRATATGTGGGIDVTCDPVPLADFYELEVSTASATGPWTPAGTFTSTRNIHAEGFTRGQDVFTHLRAANHNGASPWSDPALVLVS